MSTTSSSEAASAGTAPTTEGRPDRRTPEGLGAHLSEQLGERVVRTDVAYDQLTVTVDAAAFPQVARFCKAELGMTFFDFLSAVDEREEGFSIIARLYNHVTREGVLLKAMVPGGREEPRMPTITDVYRGANWHERETYDMFGIVFEGHPGLLPRILTVENFEGWPLRKEFKLASRVVKPWPGAKEPGGDEEAPKAEAAAALPGADPGDRAAAAKAKAERAKAKAAEARKRKAAEKAAAQASEAVPEHASTGSEDAVSASTPDDEAAAQAPAAEGTDGSIDDAEPGSAREAQQAAAGQPTSADTPDPTTPEGAAEIAGTDAAKDAAAGVTAGQDLAPGEQPDSDEPLRDPEREAEMASGGAATDSGAPGVEREGIHDLEHSTVRSDVSDQPAEEDVAAREEAGVGPGTPGTLADSTRNDHADTADPQNITAHDVTDGAEDRTTGTETTTDEPEEGADDE